METRVVDTKVVAIRVVDTGVVATGVVDIVADIEAVADTRVVAMEMIKMKMTNTNEMINLKKLIIQAGPVMMGSMRNTNITVIQSNLYTVTVHTASNLKITRALRRY